MLALEFIRRLQVLVGVYGNLPVVDTEDTPMEDPEHSDSVDFGAAFVLARKA